MRGVLSLSWPYEEGHNYSRRTSTRILIGPRRKPRKSLMVTVEADGYVEVF